MTISNINKLPIHLPQLPKQQLVKSPEEYLNSLCENPSLKELFDRSAQVSEGYTVKEHTQLVLQVALDNRSVIEPRIQNIMPWDDFILFLALHDIGKGKVSEQEDVGFSNHITFKARELENTRQILAEILPILGKKEEDAALFCVFLEHDLIGEYLKEESILEETFERLIEMSVASNTSLMDFLEFMTAFHLCDAGSYPTLQHLFLISNGEITYSRPLQETWEALQERVKSVEKGKSAFISCLFNALQESQSVDESQKQIQENIDELLLYLMYSHKLLLLSKPTQENKEKFKEIKNGFQYLVRTVLPDEKKLQDTFSKDSVATLFNPKNRSNENTSSFGALSDIYNLRYLHISDPISRLASGCCLFRKDYLTHLCLAKLQKKADLSNQETALLALRFFHGSNSLIFPNLKNTKNQLIPSGRLPKNIVLLTGEQNRGLERVNSVYLSGTELQGIPTAIKFAKEISFSQSPTKGIAAAYKETSEELDWFMQKAREKKEENKKNSQSQPISTKFPEYGQGFFITGHCSLQQSSFLILAGTIKRARLLNPKDFDKEYKEPLSMLLEEMQRDWKHYKTTSDYKEHMPKELDPTKALGYTYHDQYFANHFQKIEKVELALKAINEPLHYEGLQEALENPFPVIFASKTIYSFLHGDCMELNTPVKAMIGRDIQVIFTPKESMQQLEKIVKQEGLQVETIEMEFLQQVAQKLDTHFRYFFDIFSKKKSICLPSNIFSLIKESLDDNNASKLSQSIESSPRRVSNDAERTIAAYKDESEILERFMEGAVEQKENNKKYHPNQQPISTKSPLLGQGFFVTERCSLSQKSFSRLSAHIRRARILNPKAFDKKYKKPLNMLLEEMQRDWKHYKTTLDYKEHMPKELDPIGALGYTYHDSYYAMSFQQTDKLKSALEAVNYESSLEAQKTSSSEKGLASEKIKTYIPSTNTSSIVKEDLQLKESYEVLTKEIQTIIHEIKSKDWWDVKENQEKFTTLMEKALEHMKLWWSTLKDQASNHKAKMANLAKFQKREAGEPNFAYSYFYNSITDIYHKTRSYSYLEFRKGVLGEDWYWTCPKLTQDMKQPFFTENTEQIKWRKMYNQFCQMIKDHKMSILFRENNPNFDRRFIRWSQPDLNITDDFFPFPDSIPT